MKLGVKVRVREAVERGLELADHRSFAALQRIELRAAGAEHAVGGDELLHEDLFFGHFHVLLTHGAHHTVVALVGKARDDFRMQDFTGSFARVAHDHLREIIAPFLGNRGRVFEPAFVERFDVGGIRAAQPVGLFLILDAHSVGTLKTYSTKRAVYRPQ